MRRAESSCVTLWAGSGELYDALLDEYEPGATAAEIEGIFEPLRVQALLGLKQYERARHYADSMTDNAKACVVGRQSFSAI